MGPIRVIGLIRLMGLIGAILMAHVPEIRQGLSEIMGSIITTGTFDGIHRGHVELLRTLVSEGEARGEEAVVVTFDRHPLAVIAPARAPHMLLLPEERDKRLEKYGVKVEELHFDENMRNLSAGDWMRQMRDRYGAKALVLGYDNTFGRDGADLSLRDYELLGRDNGLEVISAPLVPGVSSSEIRKALAAGDIAAANGMLGYDWSVRGLVVHGRRMGRHLGFRTANMAVDPRLQLPAPGVYATYVTLPDGSFTPGVTNIGVRPTFDDNGAVSIETHIPGFEGDIYGKIIGITPVKRIRDEIRFESIPELKKRIESDIREALEAADRPGA